MREARAESPTRAWLAIKAWTGANKRAATRLRLEASSSPTR